MQALLLEFNSEQLLSVFYCLVDMFFHEFIELLEVALKLRVVFSVLIDESKALAIHSQLKHVLFVLEGFKGLVVDFGLNLLDGLAVAAQVGAAFDLLDSSTLNVADLVNHFVKEILDFAYDFRLKVVWSQLLKLVDLLV